MKKIPDKEILDNLAFVFFNFFIDDNCKEGALSILKILDFDYNYEKGELIYEGYSPSLIYFKEELECTPYTYSEKENTIAKIGIKKKDFFSKNISKVTPLKLKHFDVECIENVLNSMNKDTSNSMSTLLDSIGWTISLEGDTYRIHFVGGSNYELWNEVINEPIEPWDNDIEKGAIDWKTGNDWNDGLDLEKDIPKNWVENL